MSRIPTSEELGNLYTGRKYSLSEISKETGLKTHKILYWMDKYSIKRRVRSEANYIKANPNGEPFKIKNRLTRNEVKLKYLALGLYWGEGSKAVNNGVRLTNSDPGVIKQFYKYLNKICLVKNDKVRFYLQTFKDNSIPRAKEYWSNQLLIKADRIRTSTPIPSQGKGTYKKISRFGVVTLAVFNLHLKTYILKELGKMGMK